MTKRYIVSKTSFFNLLASADGMLDSMGRFASTLPFSHRYGIFYIKRFSKDHPETWLQSTYMPKLADSMIHLEHPPYQLDPPQSILTSADVATTLQARQFIKAERFIRTHLNIGIKHLMPGQALWQRIAARSNSEIAYKVADQLMFMCNEMSWDQPCWTISLKTALNECHILAVQFKYAMIFIEFYYPTFDCSPQKEHSTVLLNAADFH